ncbi:hypothetical protein [Micromonospora sp. NPDC093244]|uniref:hypothetical protein n=1 Tax=Micromonospora sp. NPDC093244 TaxID=3155071 RepID=UPI0034309228
MQLKWATKAAAKVDFKFLTGTSPQSRTSLLEKFLRSWRSLGESRAGFVMELVTSRVLDADDPLLRLVDSRTSLLNPAARTAPPRSGPGKRLTELCGHLECDLDEFLMMLDSLYFHTGRTFAVEEELAIQVMRANGLRSDGEALRSGITAVGEWVEDGRRRLEVAEVRDEIERLGLFAATTNGTVRFLADAEVPGAWDSAIVEEYRDLVPDSLHERDAELAELLEFCRRYEAGYMWWQAEPWSGKTALMATLALRPRPHFDVLSFFATARYTASSDSDAFTEALIDQLSSLLGRVPSEDSRPSARRGLLRRLLTAAAERAVRLGRPLVLVVDGLDEDTGATEASGIPSVASLLPRHPPAGLRVIVASRPLGQLPDDVAEDHPLRHCSVRALEPSPYARDLRRRATLELRQLLSKPNQAAVLAMITASGGGLTVQDLEELTNVPRYQLNELIRGVFGRSVTSRSHHWSVDQQPHRVLLFAHETLRLMAESELAGSMIEQARHRLHAWAEEYRQAGWPAITPVYLLRDYFAMLRASGDWERLSACALDVERHERMLHMTGGDAAALSEIRVAQAVGQEQSRPDLASLLRLAMHRDELDSRNANLPSDLPAVWASLGSFIRARSLARAIPNEASKAKALAALAAYELQSGDHSRAAGLLDEAEQAARAAAGLDGYPGALATVARQLETADKPQDAARMVSDATQAARGQHKPEKRAAALIEVAEAHPAHAPALLLEAESAAMIADDTFRKVSALAAIAAARSRLGQRDEATRLLAVAEQTDRSLHPAMSAAALGTLVPAVVSLGDISRAEALIQDVIRAFSRDEAVTAVVDASAIENPDRAKHLAATLTEPFWQARTCTTLARTAARRGDRLDAAQLADTAERYARSSAYLPRRAHSLAQVAIAIGRYGQDKERARALCQLALVQAEATKDPDDLDWVLESIATGFAEAGDYRAAERCARTIATRGREDAALGAIVEALARASRLAEAEALVAEISDKNGRSQALSYLVSTFASAGDAEQAQRLAMAVPDTKTRVSSLVELASAQIAAGDIAGAISTGNLAAAVPHSESYSQSLARSAIACLTAELGDTERAKALCGAAEREARQLMKHPVLFERALIATVQAFAAVGERAYARLLATSLAESTLRITALGGLMQAAHRAGDRDEAESLRFEAERVANALQDPSLRDEAYHEIAQAAAAYAEWATAETSADHIIGSARRSSAYADLARAALSHADSERARRLAARAVSAGDWTASLTVIAQVNSAALAQTADALKVRPR